VDVFEPSSGAQINDLNPGITPSGLFWTMAIPAESVHVEFDDDSEGDSEDNPEGIAEEGSASMRVRNIPVTDFHDFNNALFGGGPAPVSATLSFEVRWSGGKERLNITNPAQGFAGKFIRNQAQMEWSAISGDFSFESAPASTSSSVFAEIGHMRNGTFLR
jgi:hypothetical protein